MSNLFKLNLSDKNFLQELIRTGSRDSRSLKCAYVLLALNDGKEQDLISEYYHLSRTTIWRIKKKYLEAGIDRVFEIVEREGKPKQYNRRDVKALINLSKSVPPEGKRFWTVQLLIAFMETNNALKKMNRETIRLVLKKHKIKLRKK